MEDDDEAQEPPPWRPLNRRNAPSEDDDYDVLHEGIPNHLRPGVKAWLTAAIKANRNRVGRIERTLQLEWATGSSEVFRQTLLTQDDETLLTVIDALLRQMQIEYYEATELDGYLVDAREVQHDLTQQVIRMSQLLRESSSAWEITTDPYWSLQKRVSQPMRDAAESVMKSGTDAGRELGKAWGNTFRRVANYDEAYRHLVIAVESVATTFLTPKDGKPSLGKAIKHLADTPGRYTIAGLEGDGIDSQDVLLAMLRLVWINNQRHVSKGGGTPQDVEQHEAEAALYAAVTIVQWFHQGLVSER